jgi:hypothetical protein
VDLGATFDPDAGASLATYAGVAQQAPLVCTSGPTEVNTDTACASDSPLMSGTVMDAGLAPIVL